MFHRGLLRHISSSRLFVRTATTGTSAEAAEKNNNQINKAAKKNNKQININNDMFQSLR